MSFGINKVFIHLISIYLIIGLMCPTTAPYNWIIQNIQRLRHIQNSAARILLRVRKHDHITSVLKPLHWLPIPLRIEYKLSLLTHQCIHGHAPQYLKELLTLRSATKNTLQTLRTKLHTMGDRAFSSAAPRLWNTLPDHLRAPQTAEAFKRDLKTHLFKKAYC